jgi:hypothetical protein
LRTRAFALNYFKPQGDATISSIVLGTDTPPLIMNNLGEQDRTPSSLKDAPGKIDFVVLSELVRLSTSKLVGLPLPGSEDLSNA